MHGEGARQGGGSVSAVLANGRASRQLLPGCKGRVQGTEFRVAFPPALPIPSFQKTLLLVACLRLPLWTFRGSSPGLPQRAVQDSTVTY